jgi:hypothetical protein
MLITILEIDQYRTGQQWHWEQAYLQHTVPQVYLLHRVEVPLPEQAGDTPSQMFAERQGLRDRMRQYGEQPHS